MEPSGLTQDLVVDIKNGKFDGAGASPHAANQTAVSHTDEPRLFIAGSDIPTVAIIPFGTIGPDPVPDYFSRGILEDTVCLLATLREPRVISSNSTWGLDPGHFSRTDDVRKLGADYVVTGTIRRAGEDYHLSVHLSDVRTGLVEWAQIYSSPAADLFEVQLEVAASIAQRLVPSLRIAELRRTKGSKPEDLNAYHLTLQARDMAFRLDRDSFDEAGQMLQLACQKDPQFAPSHVLAADWFSIRMGQGWSTDVADDQMNLEHYAKRAVELHEGNGRALAMLGHNRTIIDHNFDEGQALFEKAINASPNDAETLMWSSPASAFVGDYPTAIARAEKAISLSPSDPFLFRFEHFLSIAYYSAGKFADAAHWGLESHRRNPNYTSNLRMTAASLAACENSNDARRFASQVLQLDPDYSVKTFLANQPFRSRKVGEQYAAHLRLAGLKD